MRVGEVFSVCSDAMAAIAETDVHQNQRRKLIANSGSAEIKPIDGEPVERAPYVAQKFV